MSTATRTEVCTVLADGEAVCGPDAEVDEWRDAMGIKEARAPLLLAHIERAAPIEDAAAYGCAEQLVGDPVGVPMREEAPQQANGPRYLQRRHQTASDRHAQAPQTRSDSNT